MTTITADQYAEKLDAVAHMPQMREDNIRLRSGRTQALSLGLIVAGLGLLALTLLGGATVGWKHALASYQVGVMGVLAISLGSLFWVMVFEMTNAGWHTTMKRQWQNIMMNTWFCMVLLLVFVAVELVNQGVLLKWLDPAIADTHLIEHKKPFLNAGFFMVRFLVYLALWSFLTVRLYRLSVRQDSNGDRWLTQKARYMSGWGLVALALSLTFAAFDYMMSMDYRFFSTMWGVYYFAGGALGSVCLLVLVMFFLRRAGKLEGVYTQEHQADLGKLMFAFTVFWTYISYGQYFLIWYSNIPEETSWFLVRTTGEWKPLFVLLMLGKFLAPFVLLLFRPLKRSGLALPLVAVWILVTHFLDMVFIIRPMVYVGDLAGQAPGPSSWWVDFVAVAGVLALYLGVLVRRIGSGPLIAVRDPRLDEGLAHKNFVG